MILEKVTTILGQKCFWASGTDPSGDAAGGTVGETLLEREPPGQRGNTSKWPVACG